MSILLRVCVAITRNDGMSVQSQRIRRMLIFNHLITLPEYDFVSSSTSMKTCCHLTRDLGCLHSIFYSLMYRPAILTFLIYSGINPLFTSHPWVCSKLKLEHQRPQVDTEESSGNSGEEQYGLFLMILFYLIIHLLCVMKRCVPSY